MLFSLVFVKKKTLAFDSKVDSSLLNRIPTISGQQQNSSSSGTSSKSNRTNERTNNKSLYISSIYPYIHTSLSISSFHLPIIHHHHIHFPIYQSIEQSIAYNRGGFSINQSSNNKKKVFKKNSRKKNIIHYFPNHLTIISTKRKHNENKHEYHHVEFHSGSNIGETRFEQDSNRGRVGP